jgi:hypothetical protein
MTRRLLKNYITPEQKPNDKKRSLRLSIMFLILLRPKLQLQPQLDVNLIARVAP